MSAIAAVVSAAGGLVATVISARSVRVARIASENHDKEDLRHRADRVEIQLHALTSAASNFEASLQPFWKYSHSVQRHLLIEAERDVHYALHEMQSSAEFVRSSIANLIETIPKWESADVGLLNSWLDNIFDVAMFPYYTLISDDAPTDLEEFLNAALDSWLKDAPKSLQEMARSTFGTDSTPEQVAIKFFGIYEAAVREAVLKIIGCAYRLASSTENVADAASRQRSELQKIGALEDRLSELRAQRVAVVGGARDAC